MLYPIVGRVVDQRSHNFCHEYTYFSSGTTSNTHTQRTGQL